MKQGLTTFLLVCVLILSILGGPSCTNNKKIIESNDCGVSDAIIEHQLFDVLANGQIDSIFLLDPVADFVKNIYGVGYKVCSIRVDLSDKVQRIIKDGLLSEGRLIKHEVDIVSYGVFMPDIALYVRSNDELVKAYVAFTSNEVVICNSESAFSYDLEDDDNKLLLVSQKLFQKHVFGQSLREEADCRSNENQ